MRFLITIIILLIIIAVYVNSVVSSFKIKFDEFANIVIKGVDFNSLNANQTVISARVKLFVSFSSFFGITISDLNIKAYSNNILIAESTKNFAENVKKIKLIPNVDNLVYQTFDFHINSQSIGLIAKIKSKQPYSINYQVSFKLFGIPLSKSGSYQKI